MTTESYWNSQSYSLVVQCIPPWGIHLEYPGAVHRARWMARAIYSIKLVQITKPVYNFRKQQKVSRRGSSASYGQTVWNHLRSVSIFVTRIYVRLVSMSICNRRFKE